MDAPLEQTDKDEPDVDDKHYAPYFVDRDVWYAYEEHELGSGDK